MNVVFSALEILKALELPKDIYTVVLHVNDSSLTTNATNYVDAILNFHKGMKPMDDPLYPEEVNILRGAMLFTRVIQPHQMMEEHSPKFWLANSSWIPPGGVAPFNVTGEGGIIYVSDSLALQSAPDIVQLTIAWDSPGSAMLSVRITNGTSEVCNGTKNSGSAPMMCSSQKSWEMCTMLCGLGTGGNNTTYNGIKDKMEFMSKGGCAWRGQKNVNEEMTMEYATCTPDISTCPDGMCDSLEQMNLALCPQDCIPTDKLSGTGMKGSNSSQGIMSAAGVCTCEPSGICKCEKLTDMSNVSTTEMVAVINPSVAPFSQEECPEEDEEGSRCGSLCQLAIIIACLLLLAFVIAFLLWRFKWSQGAMVCPTTPCSCTRESCSTCMNCSSGTKCSTCPRCPSCPYCSACPACFSCSPSVCKGGSLCNWLPQKFQRTEPAPTVSATPSSRVSTEFVQSVDAHLLPYNYMGPLGNMNPGHK
ncbi:uncharacterized protein [Anabrus simplex]|uniref:uncharacterized protein n=1 Tax=Anabrus simplex TaxID=316456 RepID=UPI0035A3B8C7